MERVYYMTDRVLCWPVFPNCPNISPPPPPIGCAPRRCHTSKTKSASFRVSPSHAFNFSCTVCTCRLHRSEGSPMNAAYPPTRTYPVRRCHTSKTKPAFFFFKKSSWLQGPLYPEKISSGLPLLHSRTRFFLHRLHEQFASV